MNRYWTTDCKMLKKPLEEQYWHGIELHIDTNTSSVDDDSSMEDSVVVARRRTRRVLVCMGLVCLLIAMLVGGVTGFVLMRRQTKPKDDQLTPVVSKAANEEPKEEEEPFLVTPEQTLTDSPNKYTWPELLHRPVNQVVEIIQHQRPDVQIVILEEGVSIATDFDPQRVRVFINQYQLVTQPPRVG